MKNRDNIVTNCVKTLNMVPIRKKKNRKNQKKKNLKKHYHWSELLALGPWSEDAQPRPHADPVTQGGARPGWASLLPVFTVGRGADREGRRLLRQRVSVLTVSAFLARVPSHFRRA